MIYFAEKPTRAFHVLVKDALADAISDFESMLIGRRRYVASDLDFCALGERDKKLFTASLYVGELKKLTHAHSDSCNLWHISDYHWLILDRELRSFINLNNDFLAQGDIQHPRPYFNHSLTDFAGFYGNFDILHDTYFHDCDYECIDGLTRLMADTMAMNPETYGLQRGVKFNPRNRDHAMRVLKPVVKNMSWSWKED